MEFGFENCVGTLDVTKLCTRHGEQPGCFKGAWLHWCFF